MIARVSILLPFDILIRESDELPALESSTPDYRVTFHPPLLSVHRSGTTDGALDSANALRQPRRPDFSDNLLADGRRVARANVLILDFTKDDFDRRNELDRQCDPDLDLVFELANCFLSKLRAYSRSFQIKYLVPLQDPCVINYLTNTGEELEKEEGKVRIRVQGQATVGFPVITPDAIMMIADPTRQEPYTWDQLLLDAHDLLPDVGGAVALAAAALETLIAWALDILHQEQPLPAGLWEWINSRSDHTKEPSVGEKFDVLLRVFTGRSLKDEAQLWQGYQELRAARNSLVHKGIPIVGNKQVNAAKATELVKRADGIAKWVELLLPEAHRRFRTDAAGRFTRRLASQETKVTGLRFEADAGNQGDVRIFHRPDQPVAPEERDS